MTRPARPRRARTAPLLACATALAVLLLAGAWAQSDAADAEETEAPDERRVITIDSSGGSQSGNLRYGPIHYEHPEPDGIRAQVSDLHIFAPRAELRGPEDTLLSQARGQRTATFEDGVRVTRNRLEAEGPGLVYRESTGLGEMSGGVSVRIEPEEDTTAEDADDPTLIDADEIAFDVDTDRSVSRGGVVLRNGAQRAEADELTFAEAQDLGQLVCDDRCTVTRTDEDGGEMRITAQEVRVLTAEERLWAEGDVEVVDGDITSRGQTVFFDDTQGYAEVIGRPATSVDEANGVRLESDRIRQDIEFDFVEAIDASEPSDFDREAFHFDDAP